MDYMEEKIYLPQFLEELTQTDFSQLKTEDLAKLSVKTKAAISALGKADINSPKSALLKGFLFYDQQMSAELKRRHCILVSADDLLKNNPEVIKQVLKSYPFDKLLLLLEGAEDGETEGIKLLKELIKQEISSRANVNGGVVS